MEIKKIYQITQKKLSIIPSDLKITKIYPPKRQIFHDFGVDIPVLIGKCREGLDVHDMLGHFLGFTRRRQGHRIPPQPEGGRPHEGAGHSTNWRYERE